MWVCLSTTLAALVLSGAGLTVYDAQAYRSAYVEDLRTHSQIVALSSAPALLFDDRQAARENLASLRARESIGAAALYDESGELFASYARTPGFEPPSRLSGERAQEEAVRSGSLLLVREPVRDTAGGTIGTIELRGRFEPFARVRDYVAILLAVMLASTLLALLLSARLQRTITTPIVSMAAVARGIIERRDYSLRAERTTDDELATLVEALNEMLQAIEQEMKVRLAAEAALRVADARKDEFLATLAHELRNPLAALSSASHLLRRAADDPRASTFARETLARQTNHMTRLLDDLLDVSRITRGKLALRREPTTLGAVVDAAVDSARPLIDEKAHVLELEVHDRNCALVADSVRLAQIVGNLLTNAAKYTDRGGRILLATRLRGTELELLVRDNGIGIPAESLPSIFGMFSQVHSALDRSQGGLGIGLALAKGLAELHGGSIAAHSAGAGAGSEFIVRIPLNETQPNARGSAVLDAAWATAPRRLMIADDNRDALVSLALLLELDGHEVATVGDGEAALETAAKFKPDVALIDIGMPKLNGYQVARRLRAMPHGHALTLIAVTGWGQAEDKRRAAEAGFDHHLTKPIDPDSLRALLAETAPAREPSAASRQSASG